MPKGFSDPMTVAMHAAHIATCWAKCHSQADTYTPKELERLFSLPMRASSGVLLLLGWRRRKEFTKHRGRRTLTTRWYPPGTVPPKRLRGRPRIDLLSILLA
jgi:hypothetical protein